MPDMKHFFAKTIFSVLLIGVLVNLGGCANQPTVGSIPVDMQNYKYGRYIIVDDIVSDFQRAGSPIRQFEQGGIVDIPYRLTDESMASIQPAFERTCLNMMGNQGKPQRGDNLHPFWQYLSYEGGSIVNYDDEVNRVVSLLQADSKNNWAIPSSRYNIGKMTYICSIFEQGILPEYRVENLQKPLFLALNRCEYEKGGEQKFTGTCHWIVIRTPNLLDKVRQTRHALK